MPYTVGISAKCNLDMLQRMFQTIKSLRGPWCIGGDWNGTPQELEATGWLKLVRGTVKAPTTPTCNGRVTSFFVNML